MQKIILLFLLACLLSITAHAQRKTLPQGSEVIVKEITSWDPNYNNKDKIVGKKAVVTTRPLLFSHDDHWSGFITVDGNEYRLLDMRINILSGEVPEKKIEPKDVLKLKAQLKELMELSTQDFSSIKSTVAKSRPYNYVPSFLANYQINGTEDSSTLIYYDEVVRRWNLYTVFNIKQYSSMGIDYIIRTLDWPCGKLEPLTDKDKLDTSANISSIYYVPVNRNQAGNKYRYFTMHLSATFHDGKDAYLTLGMLNRAFDVDLLVEQTSTPAPVFNKDFKKMEKDLLTLAESYKMEFNNIKTAKRFTDLYFPESYEARCEFEGGDPGSGTVYFDTLSKSWGFSISISTEKYNFSEVEKVLLNTTFPFGKLEKKVLSWESSSQYYKPKDQDKLPVAYNKMEFSLFPFKIDGKEISLTLSILKSKY